MPVITWNPTPVADLRLTEFAEKNLLSSTALKLLETLYTMQDHYECMIVYTPDDTAILELEKSGVIKVMEKGQDKLAKYPLWARFQKTSLIQTNPLLAAARFTEGVH